MAAFNFPPSPGTNDTYELNGVTYQYDGTKWVRFFVALASNISDQNNTSTGYFDLPVGATSERPGTPANGMVRYNTSLEVVEGYINGGWATIQGNGFDANGYYIDNTTAIADDLYVYWDCDSTSTTRAGGDSGTATLYGVTSSGGKVGNSWDRGTTATNGINLTSMPTGNNITIMFWTYLSDNTIHSTGDGAGILWLDSSSSSKVILGYDGSNGNDLRFGGDNWIGNGEIVYNSFGTTNVWHHMAITQSSTTWKFYLNGTEVTTRSESMTNDGDWWLGNYSRHGGNTNNHYYRGRFDEIAIWDRTLTSTQISKIYDAQSNSTGLV